MESYLTFSSPYGEQFYKLIETAKKAARAKSFRPLTGNNFINLKLALKELKIPVFVPLRGTIL